MWEYTTGLHLSSHFCFNFSMNCEKMIGVLNYSYSLVDLMRFQNLLICVKWQKLVLIFISYLEQRSNKPDRCAINDSTAIGSVKCLCNLYFFSMENANLYHQF